MASLRKLSVADLRRELDRREKGSTKLLAQHKKLSARLGEIDAELADLGVDAPKRRGRPPGRKPGRRGPGRPKGGRKAKGGMTLMQALEKGVRMGSTVSPAEAAQAAKRVGYRTASKTFGIQVATTLAKASGFKKTGRGQYLRTAGGGNAPKKRGRPKGSKNKQETTKAA